MVGAHPAVVAVDQELIGGCDNKNEQPGVTLLVGEIMCDIITQTFYDALAELGPQTNEAAQPVTVDELVQETIGGGAQPPTDGTLPVEDEPKPASPTFDAFVRDAEQVVVKKHRRVHKHAKQPFVSGLVAEVKAKFGLMQRTGANELVVRRVLHQRCEELKLRPTHAKQAISRAIELVFMPDSDDAFAERMKASYAARDRWTAWKKAKYGAWYFLPYWFLKKFGSHPNEQP